MDDPNSCFSARFVIIGVFSLVHFASIATSFQVSRTKLQRLSQGKQQNKIKWPLSLQSRVGDYDQDDRSVSSLPIFPRISSTRSNNVKLWLSSSQEPENTDAKSEEEKRKENASAAQDDLYDFLTSPTGGGESGRIRKRDQIMDFMGRGSVASSTSGEEKNLIQPIRTEDGKVDKELVGQQQEEERTKVKVDSLFSGMPTLEEIISRSPTNIEEDTNTDTKTKRKTRMTDDDDFSWFEAERLQIEREYQQLGQETKRRIREQRLEEEEIERLIQAIAESENDEEDGDSLGRPSSIPDNAESVADAIVKQEMNRMINSVQLERAKQRLQAFESERTSELESRDYQGVTDNVVDNIIKETADELEQNAKLKAGADEYQQYERVRQHEASIKETHEESVPKDGADLDNWTLDRLREMLKKSESREDDDGSITDILEDNIEELRKQIERESKKGTIEPQTMKEWQMYQAIATRLIKDQQKDDRSTDISTDAFDTILNGGIGVNDSDSVNDEQFVDEVQVAQQLDSWREYVEKEDKLRQKMDLSSGYELPFGHLGTKMDQIEAEAEQDTLRNDNEGESKGKSRREVRREVNIQAVQAMEDLIQKSDGRRAEFLQKQLEVIKEGMEENDYYDTEEEEEQLVSLEPIDLTDVFVQSEEDNNEDSTFSSEEMDGINQLLSSSETGAPYSGRSESGEESVQKREPPNTPFFNDDSISESTENQAPVPDTPFFQDTEDITEEEEVVDVDNKLGSADEQKIQKMFRKANVRSYAEQDAMRKNWEEYQKYEKEIRDKSGLSKSTDENGSPSLTDGVELQYDPTDFMTEDGDFDAEKVLSTIGPRPTKRKAPSEESETTTPTSKPPDRREDLQSDIDPSEVADAIYRSVAASGGIGREDKTIRKKDRAEYDAYLKKEEEMKIDLDGLEDELDEVEPEDSELADLDIDDPDYADEVLGPRPLVKRKRKLDERELSDMGGFPASSTDAEEDQNSDGDDVSGFNDLVPDWLQKEREAAGKSEGKGLMRKKEREGRNEGKGIGGTFLGRDNGEVFEDDKYGRESLEEYEQRRAGQGRNMGIDIRDVLERRGPDDASGNTYGTDRYQTKQEGWEGEAFETRKAKLLGYIQLELSELNNLIALKDSADAAGASQYLSRINKPFKEFGAIFRLEGVLVDITGLQQKAWNRVAVEFDLQEPLLEDVRRAAVLKPEDAVKEVFYTAMGDFVLVRKLVDAFRRIFRQEFDLWAGAEGLVVKLDDPNAGKTVRTNSFAIGFEEEEDTKVEQEIQPAILPSDEGSLLRYLQGVWNKTAKQFGFPSPSNEQIAESSIVTPDIAVSSIFCWSQEQKQINKIVAAYSILQAGGNIPLEEETNIAPPPSVPTNRPLQREEITDDMILELQFMAWGDVAEENSFEVPGPEEVLAAASINNPEFVILDGFGWTDDPTVAAELASNYLDYLSEYINKYIHNRPFTPTATESNSIMVEATPDIDNASLKMATAEEKEFVSRQTDAWKETATEFDFDAPSIDQIMSVADMSPEDAVIKLLLTNFNIDDCDAAEEEEFYDLLPEIIETYESALKKPSKKYLAESNTVVTEVTASRDNNAASAIPTEEEIISRQFDAWKQIATKYGFKAPLVEQIRLATDMSLEDTVHKLILMNNDIENCASDQIEEFYEELPEIIEAYELALENSSTQRKLVTESNVDTSQSSRQVSQDEIYCASFDAWTSVAWKLGFRLPTQEDVQFAMTVGPKEAIISGYYWTKSEEEAEGIVQQYLDQIKGRRDEWVKQGYTTSIQIDSKDIEKEDLPLVEALPDVLDWIKSLKAVEMGCGVVTHLENDQMKILLEYAGLLELFPDGNRVSYSNGYLLDNQQLLGTSLRIERRPDQCVVFDTSPHASVAAHDFDMTSVAMIGPYPRYELLDADTSAASVTELTATNIRRLFGERIYDKPMLDTEGENPLQANKPVQTKTKFEGDE